MSSLIFFLQRQTQIRLKPDSHNVNISAHRIPPSSVAEKPPPLVKKREGVMKAVKMDVFRLVPVKGFSNNDSQNALIPPKANDMKKPIS
jgi:hypothetical protein